VDVGFLIVADTVRFGEVGPRTYWVRVISGTRVSRETGLGQCLGVDDEELAMDCDLEFTPVCAHVQEASKRGDATVGGMIYGFRRCSGVDLSA
jgi:hypothetical protein